jgi:hypothetical protein
MVDYGVARAIFRTLWSQKMATDPQFRRTTMGALHESNNPNEKVLVIGILFELFESAWAKECKRMEEAGEY